MPTAPTIKIDSRQHVQPGPSVDQGLSRVLPAGHPVSAKRPMLGLRPAVVVVASRWQPRREMPHEHRVVGLRSEPEVSTGRQRHVQRLTLVQDVESE